MKKFIILLITIGLLTTGVSYAASLLYPFQGGTGIGSYTAGDILIATSTDTLYALPKSSDGKVLKLVSGKPAWGTDNTGAGGSPIILDLADDGANESTDLTEIAITNDTNSIFTEPSADKLLINLSNNYPIADTANAGDAAVDFFGAGVDAVTDATTCTNIEGTHLSIGGGVLNVADDWWDALTDMVLTDNYIYVGDASNDPVGVAMSNDCTIASSGAITCDHDALDNFVANEHLDWTGDLGATNIHTGNYPITDSEVPNSITIDLATLASTITVADESTDTTCYVGYFTGASGSLAAKTGTNLTFNSNTGVLTASGFAGPLTGNVTGDCSGSSGSCTGNAATVSNATFTTALTVDTGTVGLTGNVANNSVLTIGAGASSISGANTGDQDLSGYWDADGDVAADEISEGKIAFSTACAAGNHYYLNGNDLACEADDVDDAIASCTNVNTCTLTADAITDNLIVPADFAHSQDYGDFTIGAGGSFTLDTGVVGDNEIDYANVTLTDFDYQTNWRVFYSNGSGDVTELALGADGTYLKSNGAAAAPTFASPGGAGTVTNVFDCADGDCNTLTVGTSEWLVYGTGFIDANRFAGVTTVDGTEFGYLNDVTSAIQTQFANKQPLDAQLTDIADGTLTGNFINTANPWADNEVSDTLTCSSCTGESATVATITGLAPDTATTQAAQAAITSLGTLSALTMGGDINLDGSNIDNGGVIFLKEQADADADVAGSGQIWVNTATPNELWFTDDAGTDVQLGVAGATPTDITVADESVDETCFMGFFTAATGDLGPKTGTNVTFNSNTGILTASGFTGNVTGDCTGSSGSCTGNAATVTGYTPASGSITLAGADALTITTSAATGVTLPTSGTLYGTAADTISSANLLSSLSDETGTGLAVFGTSPTFTTGITVPANSISDDEINEGDTFEWTAAHTWTGALTVGVDNAGHDIIFYGASTGRLFQWDESADKLIIDGASEFGDQTNKVIISNAGVLTFAGTADIDLPNDSVDAADIATINCGRSTTWDAANDEVDADSELYTDTKCMYFEDPVAADDFKSIWTANGFAATITKMWCESDQTVNMDLQVDDGSPADVNGADLVCDSTPAEDESMGGDATLADGERLDLAITSVSGTPTWVSICWTYTKDD